MKLTIENESQHWGAIKGPKSSGYQRVILRDIVVRISIGLYPHERLRPQRISFSADLWADPSKLADGGFIDYDRLRLVVGEEWPLRPHVLLLETLAEEAIVLALSDVRVTAARVRIEKLDVCAHGSVGVEIMRERTAW